MVNVTVAAVLGNALPSPTAVMLIGTALAADTRPMVRALRIRAVMKSRFPMPSPPSVATSEPAARDRSWKKSTPRDVTFAGDQLQPTSLRQELRHSIAKRKPIHLERMHLVVFPQRTLDRREISWDVRAVRPQTSLPKSVTISDIGVRPAIGSLQAIY